MATPDRGMSSRRATASLTCRLDTTHSTEPHLGFSRYTGIHEICHHDDILLPESAQSPRHDAIAKLAAIVVNARTYWTVHTRCDYQAGELNWERRASWDPIHIHRPHPPSTSIQPSTHSHREQMTNDTFASPSSSASAYSRPVNTSAWPLIQAKSLVDKRYQDPLRLSLSHESHRGDAQPASGTLFFVH